MLPPLPEVGDEPLLPAPGALPELPELEPDPELPLLVGTVVPPLDELPPLPLGAVDAGLGPGVAELLPQPPIARARAGAAQVE